MGDEKLSRCDENFMNTEKNKVYLSWLKIDCTCCAGIEWGGDYPRECRTCGGSGQIFLHVKSGSFAQWPGGPFCGKMAKNDLAFFELLQDKT